MTCKNRSPIDQVALRDIGGDSLVDVDGSSSSSSSSITSDVVSETCYANGPWMIGIGIFVAVVITVLNLVLFYQLVVGS